MIVIEVSKVLEVVGGLSLFIAILYIMVGICGYTCSAVECCRICALASCPVIVVGGLAQFGVQIWASVVVFGAYSTWEYKDKLNENSIRICFCM